MLKSSFAFLPRMVTKKKLWNSEMYQIYFTRGWLTFFFLKQVSHFREEIEFKQEVVEGKRFIQHDNKFGL